MAAMNAKGRREGGAYVPIPCSVLDSPNFHKLSGSALKLLTALMAQIRFKKHGPINNGDLCATWSMMKRPGIGSKSTLSVAKLELIHYGFIKLTRQGEALRSDKPSLYAITWWGVNECNGKLEAPSSIAPSNEWKAEKPLFQKPKNQKEIGNA